MNVESSGHSQRAGQLSQADLQFLAAQLAEEMSNTQEAEEEDAARRAGGGAEAAPRLGRQLVRVSLSRNIFGPSRAVGMWRLAWSSGGMGWQDGGPVVLWTLGSGVAGKVQIRGAMCV